MRKYLLALMMVAVAISSRAALAAKSFQTITTSPVCAPTAPTPAPAPAKPAARTQRKPAEPAAPMACVMNPSGEFTGQFGQQVPVTVECTSGSPMRKLNWSCVAGPGNLCNLVGANKTFPGKGVRTLKETANVSLVNPDLGGGVQAVVDIDGTKQVVGVKWPAKPAPPVVALSPCVNSGGGDAPGGRCLCPSGKTEKQQRQADGSTVWVCIDAVVVRPKTACEITGGKSLPDGYCDCTISAGVTVKNGAGEWVCRGAPGKDGRAGQNGISDLGYLTLETKTSFVSRKGAQPAVFFGALGVAFPFTRTPQPLELYGMVGLGMLGAIKLDPNGRPVIGANGQPDVRNTSLIMEFGMRTWFTDNVGARVSYTDERFGLSSDPGFGRDGIKGLGVGVDLRFRLGGNDFTSPAAFIVGLGGVVGMKHEQVGRADTFGAGIMLNAGFAFGNQRNIERVKRGEWDQNPPARERTEIASSDSSTR